MTLPTDVAPNQTYVNTAGVRQFQSPTNTGTPFTYYPAENIDPTFEAEHTPNTGKIKDPATVSTEEVGLVKGRTTSVTQDGNNAETQATIGETVNYTIEASVPAGSQLFGIAETHRSARPTAGAGPGHGQRQDQTQRGDHQHPDRRLHRRRRSRQSGAELPDDLRQPARRRRGDGHPRIRRDGDRRRREQPRDHDSSSITNVATLNWQDQNATPKNRKRPK